MKNKKDAIKKFNRFLHLNHLYLWKNSYNSVIPLKLYTCWHTKQLPTLMKNNYEELMKKTPNFEHFLYDDIDCLEFIKKDEVKK